MANDSTTEEHPYIYINGKQVQVRKEWPPEKVDDTVIADWTYRPGLVKYGR